METIILVVHVVLALGIIGLIMLQQGKGAEMGASFGSGSSQTVFGAAGSGNLFSRMTGIMTAIFFVTSLSLAVVAKNASVIDDDFVPATGAEAVIGEPDDSVSEFEAGANVADEAESEFDAATTAVESGAAEVEASAEAGAAEAKKVLDDAVKTLETESQTQ